VAARRGVGGVAEQADDAVAGQCPAGGHAVEARWTCIRHGFNQAILPVNSPPHRAAGCRHLSAIESAKWVPHHASRRRVRPRAPGSGVADPFGTQRSRGSMWPVMQIASCFHCRHELGCHHWSLGEGTRGGSGALCRPPRSTAAGVDSPARPPCMSCTSHSQTRRSSTGSSTGWPGIGCLEAVWRSMSSWQRPRSANLYDH
jgi:hypothetical protein